MEMNGMQSFFCKYISTICFFFVQGHPEMFCPLSRIVAPVEKATEPALTTRRERHPTP